MRQAVLDGHKLRIRYDVPDQNPTWRTVDPIGLVTAGDHGYLLATRDGADRTYRLSRIMAAEELPETADRPTQVDLDQVWRDRSTAFRTGGDQIAVRARIDPMRFAELAGTALSVAVEATDPDGWHRVQVTFQDGRHAEWALWQLAAGAETLDPPWLRARMRERADEMATRHS